MHQTRRPHRSFLLILSLSALCSQAWSQEARDVRTIPRVQPRIISARPGVPVGEPYTVQLSLRNPSSVPVEIPQECLRPSAFRLRRAGENRTAKARRNKGPGPMTLAPGRTVLQVFDLRRHFKELRKTGHFWASWSCGSWKTPIHHLFVVEPYHPESDKVAKIITEIGELEMVLLGAQAPLHVRTFVELARAGYYDGLYLERLVPGLQVEVGDRAGSQQGKWDHQLPPEIDSKIIPGKGLVGAVRRQTTMTSATRFFILLDSAANFAGLHTFFAYVRSGGEVLEAIKGRRVLAEQGAGAFVMKEPVRIDSVEIHAE